MFQDCIAGNVMWVGNYNRNMERRRLREVNANVVLQEEPAIEIINSEDEWCYWYHNLIIGKLYKVIVSEGCMEKCLRTCLDEVIVTQDNLHSYDGITDIAFLGTKKKILLKFVQCTKTRSNTMEIKRDVYLEQFKIRKDNGMIKIITGKCVNIGRHRTKGEDEAAEYN